MNDSRYALPGLIGLFVVLGLLAVGRLNLDNLRPYSEFIQSSPSANDSTVEIRLWQDPFAALYKRENELGREKGSQPELGAHKEPLQRKTSLMSALGDKNEGLRLFIVGLPHGWYGETVERRRGSRYAMIAALANSGYHPKTSDYINLLPPAEIDFDGCKRDYCPDIPYEVFEKGDSSEKIAVFWVSSLLTNDGFFSSTIALADKLNGHLRREVNGRDVMLGPITSDELDSAASMEEIDLSDSEARLKSESYLFINWSATSRRRSELDASIRDDSCPDVAEDSYIRARHYDRFTVADLILPDLRLAELLREEMKQRGLYREFLRKKPVNIAIVGESDSLYARNFAENFEEALMDDCDGMPSINVFRTSYLRGMDGSTNTRAGTPQDSTGKLESANLYSRYSSGANQEYPMGKWQFDYLRRSASQLKEELGHLDVVAVVGSDVYDKISVMQAYRSVFPGALYMTTDMHALYLHPDLYPAVRNMVVATSYGLATASTLREEPTYRWPPFRDAYQTSLYNAALYAATNLTVRESIDGLPDLAEKSGPIVLEIGRNTATQLSSVNESALPSKHLAVSLFTISPFALLVVLAAFLLKRQRELFPATSKAGSGIPKSEEKILRYLEILHEHRSEIGGKIVRSLFGLSLLVAAVIVWLFFVSHNPAMPPRIDDLSSGLVFLILVGGFLAAITETNVIDYLTTGVNPRISYLRSRVNVLDEMKLAAKRRHTATTIIFLSLFLLFVFLWLAPLLVGVSEPWSLHSGISAWVGLAGGLVGSLLSLLALVFISLTLHTQVIDIESDFDIKSYRRCMDESVSSDEDLSLPKTRILSRWQTFLRAQPLRFDDGLRDLCVRGALWMLVFFTLAYEDQSFLFSHLLRTGGTASHELVSFVLVALVSITFTALCVRLDILSRSSIKLYQSFLEELSKDVPDYTRDKEKFFNAVKLVDDSRSRWSGSERLHLTGSASTPTVAKTAWLDVQFIEEMTRKIEALFYFPAMLGVVYVLSGLPFFDQWPVRGGLLFFILAALSFTLFQAWACHQSARFIKREIRLYLEEILSKLSADYPSEKGAIASYRACIRGIQEESEGAFSRLVDSPVVRAVMVAIGALGIVLSQAFFGIGYSL